MTEYQTCGVCGVAIHLDVVRKHKKWHEAIEPDGVSALRLQRLQALAYTDHAKGMDERIAEAKKVVAFLRDHS